MIRMTRTGPIGLDFGTDNLKMVQADFIKVSSVIRSAVILPYPENKSALFESPAVLKSLIKQAHSEGGFKGFRTVASIPPEKVQFVSLEYKCTAGQDPDTAVIAAIRERFGDRIGNSVIDYLHIRPEQKEQSDRTALVAVADQQEVIEFLEFLRKGGLSVDRLVIGPVAINRLISAITPEARDKIVLAINFGLQKSYATVLWGRRLVLDRELQFGLNTVVQQLSETLEVSVEEATQLLERYGVQTASNEQVVTDYMQQGIEETITDILKPLLFSLSSEIKRLMLYVASRSRGKTIHNAYIFGSVAGWPGLDKTLSEMTGIPLQTTKPFYGLATSHQAANIEDLSSLRGIAVATGLALMGNVHA